MPIKNCIKTFITSLIVVVLLCISNLLFANSIKNQSTLKKIKTLNTQYYEGGISNKDYFLRIDTLVHQFLAEGNTMETNELIKLLEPLEEIAWSDQQNGTMREVYYNLLLDNAQFSNKGGEAIYFAEKLASEMEKNTGQPTLLELYERVYFYLANGGYKKTIETYEKETKILETYPEKIAKGEISNKEIKIYFLLNNNVSIAYSRDSNATKLKKLALTTKQALENSTLQFKKDIPLYAESLIYQKLVDFDYNHFNKCYECANKNLIEIEKILTTHQKELELIAPFIYNILHDSKIELYVNSGDHKNALKYIQEIEKSPNLSPDNIIYINGFKTRILAQQNNYKEAYQILEKSFNLKEEAYVALTEEIDELLYAHVKAEYNQKALEKIEIEKRNRMILFTLLGIISLTIILIITALLIKKGRDTKKSIQKLNDMINLQIATMEEVRHQAMREEQERLGKELHDGLASTIAGIKHQVELMSIESNEIEQKKQLGRISTQLKEAYQKVRKKSHDWHNHTDNSLEQSFEKNVRNLIENALPNSHYKKDIIIDDNALISVDLKTRIEILRIIQEAVVNIIKHANAKYISILMYEENNNLNIEIKDDGKGFNIDKNKESLGLNSIKERSEKISGKLNITSNQSGTELSLIISKKNENLVLN